MRQTSSPAVPPGQQAAMHFGTFLKILRHRHRLQQLQILAHLPHWTQANYSRIESGDIAPAFDQLAAIYHALREAGVELTPQDRQQFLTLARIRIEAKKTCRELKSDQEWDALRVQLSQGEESRWFQERSPRTASGSHLMDTSQLVGREDWLASIMTALYGSFPKKLVVLQGPTGIGKSSELHRIAEHFLTSEPRPHVIVCPFPQSEQQSEPEHALDLLLATILAELGIADEAMQSVPLKVRVSHVLTCLEKRARPLLLLVDNAEHLVDEAGKLSACWTLFLTKWLRARHHATLVLATQVWPGWFEGERVFVVERMIPPFSPNEGATFLQRLGLTSVTWETLQHASEVVGGIPLCLEWIASLVQEPLWLDSWDTSDTLDEPGEIGNEEEVLTRRLLRLLDDPALFAGPLTNRLLPLLERTMLRLSVEARGLLHALALAKVPLSKPALKVLCQRPRPVKELRDASLLMGYRQQVQALPIVASAVRMQLSPEQQRQSETQLIAAYQRWLDTADMSDREIGTIIAELASLYLKHFRLLAAADLLIYYGWISFNLGYGPRLGHLAQKVMQQFDWRNTAENECGGLLLFDVLNTYLGRTVNAEKQTVDFHHVLALADEDKVKLQPATEMHPIRLLMAYHINQRRFEEAQAVLMAGKKRLEQYRQQVDVQASLFAQQAWLLARWSDYLEEQKMTDTAQSMREEAIDLYRNCCALLTDAQEASPLKSRLLKKRLSAYLNYLGYRLTWNGQAAEAIECLDQSIALGEQGYCNFGALAAAYGDMSQALMELGRLEEALIFDEKAMAEAQRCADSGDALSQDEVWIYRVNRGCLYLRLGRIDEAEQLLKEAESHIHERRSVYRMFARRALDEIKQQRAELSQPEG